LLQGARAARTNTNTAKYNKYTIKNMALPTTTHTHTKPQQPRTPRRRGRRNRSSQPRGLEAQDKKLIKEEALRTLLLLLLLLLQGGAPARQ
jgi:hypothetical protein